MPKQDTQARPARRRHAAAFKRELVERSLQPGASVSGIALEGGINANVLFRWRREHLRAAGAHGHGTARAVLLPVKVARQASSTEREVVSSCSPMPPMPAGVIEIDIGAARVRLRGALDEVDVRVVLQALKAIA
jgi:transposase